VLELETLGKHGGKNEKGGGASRVSGVGRASENESGSIQAKDPNRGDGRQPQKKPLSKEAVGDLVNSRAHGMREEKNYKFDKKPHPRRRSVKETSNNKGKGERIFT